MFTNKELNFIEEKKVYYISIFLSTFGRWSKMETWIIVFFFFVLIIFDTRSRLRQYPSLINYTTIDWVMDWPKEALIKVASISLNNLKISETITGESQVRFYEL